MTEAQNCLFYTEEEADVLKNEFPYYLNFKAVFKSVIPRN